MGTAIVKLANSNCKNVSEVMFVPKLSTNLLSVSKMSEKGFVSMFDNRGCYVYHNSDFQVKGNIELTATKVNGLYTIDQEVREPVRAMTSVESSQEKWHLRLGHLNRKGMNLLKNGMVTGVEFSDDGQGTQCIPCLEGKQTKFPFKSSSKRAKEVLELVHSDLQGPMEVESWGGARYCLIFC